jgi:uncharacterized protein involved in outer membrane biogenesis
MRKIILIFVITLGVLIILVSGAAFFLLNNENFLKSQLSDIIFEQTGRELELSGPLEIEIGRETSIDAHGIRFQNASWADQPDMVSIGRLQLTIDIPSLWDETIIVPSLALEDCSISLLKNGDGEANWDVLPESEQPKQPPPSRSSLPVHALDAQIRDCLLEVDGPNRVRPLSLAISTLGLNIEDDKRITVEGAGSLNEEPLSLSGWYEPLGVFYVGGPLRHELDLALGLISLKSSGTLEDAAHFTGANITTHFTGPEFAKLLEFAGLQPVSEGDFDFRLNLNTVEEMTRIDINGDLGSIQTRTEGQLDRLLKPGKGNISTTLEGENLEQVGQAFGVEGLVADPFKLNTTAYFENETVRIEMAELATSIDQLSVEGQIGTNRELANSKLQIALRSEEAGRWAPALGQAASLVGPLTVIGSLKSDSNGIFSIDANMSHGESILELAGEVGKLTGPRTPELQIDFKSDNPRPLATLAGRPNFPAAPLSIRGTVGQADQQIRLKDVEINLDGSLASIDGQVNLADGYAGSSLDLEIDVPDIALLGSLFGVENLPQQPLQVVGLAKQQDKGLAIKISDDDSSDLSLDLEVLVPDLANPAELDATFDIKLPGLNIIQVLLPEIPLPHDPFSAKGRLGNSKSRLELEGIELDLAGNRAQLNGHVNRAEKFAGSEVEVQFDIISLAALGQMFGQNDLPDEPLQLHSVLQPKGKGLAFKVTDGNLGDIQLELEGNIDDLDKPLAVDAEFDVQLPTIRFLEFIAPEFELPDLPFSASGQLINEQTQTRFSGVQIELGRMKSTIEGDIGYDESLDLAIQTQIPDASRLAGLTGLPLPAEPFSMKSHLQGTFGELDFQDLDARLGQGEVHGHLQVGLGDVKSITGRLDSSRLDLSWWTPEEEPTVEAVETPKSEWVFDEIPLKDISDLGVAIDMELALAHVDLGNTILTDVDLGVFLDSKRLELNPFSMGGTTGGKISGTVLIDQREAVPILDLDFHARDLRLGLLALEGQDVATYPVIDIDLDIEGSGRTRREMASSLNGKSRLFMGPGQIASSEVSFLLSDFITELFSILNPFAETSEYTNLECAVVAADIVSGQVEVAPVIFNTEQLTILSEGNIDLNTEKIDLSFHTKVRQGLGLSAGMIINPLIKVGGRMISPAIELDPAGVVVKGGLAVATVGLSLVARSMSDRFLSSKDPCGDARKEIEKRDNTAR